MTKLGTVGFERYNIKTFPENHYFIKLQEWIDQNIEANKFFNYIIVNGIPIHFDYRYKSVGICFSGGADSTMLLYLLATIIKKFNFQIKIYPISVTRFYHLDDFSDTSRNKILDYLKEIFPNIIESTIQGFLPSIFEKISIKSLQLDDTISSHIEYLIDNNATTDVVYFQYLLDWASKQYNLDAVYDGTTTNPVNAKHINTGPDFRNSLENLKNCVPTIYQFPHLPNSTVVSPFERIEKSWVIAQYYNFNIVDLLDITQSCTVLKGGCNNEECFHCSEKSWALENKVYFLEDRKL
jgi:hypothetical protein